MGQESRDPVAARLPAAANVNILPSAWREFISFCREMRHGEIERLCIQDGLPVLAELTKKKVKFNGSR